MLVNWPSAALPALVLLSCALAYGRGIDVLWRRAGVGAGTPRWRVASFYLGLAVLAVALLSPLDAAAHVAFSMHMLQHVLLVLIAPPLLVAGTPLLPLLFALPLQRRRAWGRAWRRAPLLRRAWHAVSGPLVAASLAAVALWTWHLPSLYQAAVTNAAVHALEHATLLASSCLLWWVVLQPLGRPRLHGGTALLVVFVTKIHSTVLAAMIVFAPRPLYPVYRDTLAATGRTALEDQQLAAIVMGWPMALVYLGAAGALFLTWLRSIDRRVEGTGPAYPPRGRPYL